MKQDKHKAGKDAPEVCPPADESTGIDAIQLLQYGVTALLILLVVWFVLRNILHII